MEKKNLDKLFQNEFSGFKETPADSVWDSIEVSLDKKSKRRIIPIWWKLGGVAALLALGFYILIPPQENVFSNEPNVTIKAVQKSKLEEKQNPNSERQEPIFKNESQNTAVTTTDGIEESQKEGQHHSIEEQPSRPKSKIVIPKKESYQTSANPIPEVNTEVVENSKANIGTNRIKTDDSKKQSNEVADPIDQKHSDRTSVATLLPEPKSTLDQKEIFDDTLTKENQDVTKNSEEQEGKKSIFDAIAEKEKKAEDKELKEKEVYERWAVGPSVAPVYFDALGEGSPIHSNFSQNSKSGNLNLSYGLTVSYDINKKLRVRSGVHRVDYGYDTNEISFSSSLQAPTSEIIDNITYSQSSRSLVVRSTRNLGDSDNSVTNAEFNSSPNLLDGRMVQQLGFVEVPLELNYALLDKKVGVTVIGGISSLFLVDNAVSLESDGLITNLGKANNVNDISFSTNIGLGINYRFTQKIQLNLEPVFKYQLNTFTETAGSFNPYTVGVYSGVQFRF